MSNLFQHVVNFEGGDPHLLTGVLSNQKPGRVKTRIWPKWQKRLSSVCFLGGGFKYFYFSPYLGEDFQFD